MLHLNKKLPVLMFGAFCAANIGTAANAGETTPTETSKEVISRHIVTAVEFFQLTYQPSFQSPPENTGYSITVDKEGRAWLDLLTFTEDRGLYEFTVEKGTLNETAKFLQNWGKGNIPRDIACNSGVSDTSYYSVRLNYQDMHHYFMWDGRCTTTKVGSNYIQLVTALELKLGIQEKIAMLRKIEP